MLYNWTDMALSLMYTLCFLTRRELVFMLHVFGPPALYGAPLQVYDFEYRAGLILSYEIKPLPDWVRIT